MQIKYKFHILFEEKLRLNIKYKKYKLKMNMETRLRPKGERDYSQAGGKGYTNNVCEITWMKIVIRRLRFGNRDFLWLFPS